MSFDDIYRRITEGKRGTTLKEETGESYRLTVPVNVYFEGGTGGEDVIADPPKVIITYDLEVTYRSWGIKDINVTVREVEDFTVAIENSEDLDAEVEQIPVKVAPEACEILWEAGSGYAPDMLEVTLDNAGRVKSCELSFYYYKP